MDDRPKIVVRDSFAQAARALACKRALPAKQRKEDERRIKDRTPGGKGGPRGSLARWARARMSWKTYDSRFELLPGLLEGRLAGFFRAPADAPVMAPKLLRDPCGLMYIRRSSSRCFSILRRRSSTASFFWRGEVEPARLLPRKPGNREARRFPPRSAARYAKGRRASQGGLLCSSQGTHRSGCRDP